MEELVKCKVCGLEFEAHCDDLGSYVCKCQRKPMDKKLLDQFIASFGSVLDPTDYELD